MAEPYDFRGADGVEISFDPDTLEGVARALDRLHGELSGASPGTPSHFREHALLSECRWGFGDPAHSYSVRNTVKYHHDVYQAVDRAYAEIVATLATVVRNLRKTAGILRDSEQSTEGEVQELSHQDNEAPARPPAREPAPVAPAAPANPARTAPVNPDGSFG